MPEGEPLDVSALGGSGDTDLTDLAERQHGAYAAPTQWRTPTGETADARQLIIPIGGDGSDVHIRPPDRTPRFDYTLRHNDPLREIMEERAAERTETEPQRAILPAPDGLSGVLGNGAFTVTGRVYFSPVRPFDPTPTIPELGTERLLAIENIGGTEEGFAYPREIR